MGTHWLDKLRRIGTDRAVSATDKIGIRAWTDPNIESKPGWRDSLGQTPVDVLVSYLERRSAWDRACGRSFAGPGDAGWDKLRDQLEAIHADLSTPRPLSSRDTSSSSPTKRDPRHTKLVNVQWVSPSKVILTTTEDDPMGELEPDLYEISVVLMSGEWRLKNRSAVFDDGVRIPGLL